MPLLLNAVVWVLEKSKVCESDLKRLTFEMIAKLEEVWVEIEVAWNKGEFMLMEFVFFVVVSQERHGRIWTP
jgi:hypothetical protein